MMEWIIGLLILWAIGTLSGGSSSSSSSPSSSRSSGSSGSSGTPGTSKCTSTTKKENSALDLKTRTRALRKLKRLQDANINEIPTSNNSQAINISSYEEPPPYDEIPPWIQDDTNTDIEESFKKHGISSIWHMTHKDNIKEILYSGILSNTNAYALKRPTDISDPSVQRWRDSKDPIYHRKLHDYAPTYLNIKNPMLYVRRDIQHELCLIEISLSVLSERDFLITDGNAAARITKFYNSTNDLDKLPWDVLNASYWNDFPDGKRKRCSEVLIYPMINPIHIIKLHCFSIATMQYLSKLRVPVEISEELFFGRSSLNTTSIFSSYDDAIPF